MKTTKNEKVIAMYNEVASRYNGYNNMELAVELSKKVGEIDEFDVKILQQALMLDTKAPLKLDDMSTIALAEISKTSEEVAGYDIKYPLMLIEACKLAEKYDWQSVVIPALTLEYNLVVKSIKLCLLNKKNFGCIADLKNEAAMLDKLIKALTI